MKLVENKKVVTRQYSFWITTGIAALSLIDILATNIGMLASVIPADKFSYITFSLAVASNIARFIKQRYDASLVEQPDAQENTDANTGSV